MTMRLYTSSDIRNVALAGHAHSGKTTLASAMIFAAGATSRLHTPEEGTTVTDFDEEAITRKHSISTGIEDIDFFL